MNFLMTTTTIVMTRIRTFLQSRLPLCDARLKRQNSTMKRLFIVVNVLAGIFFVAVISLLFLQTNEATGQAESDVSLNKSIAALLSDARNSPAKFFLDRRMRAQKLFSSTLLQQQQLERHKTMSSTCSKLQTSTSQQKYLKQDSTAASTSLDSKFQLSLLAKLLEAQNDNNGVKIGDLQTSNSMEHPDLDLKSVPTKNNNFKESISVSHYDLVANRDFQKNSDLDTSDSNVDLVLDPKSLKKNVSRKFFAEAEHHENDEKLDLDPKDFDSIFVNDDLRVLYCQVPKVACTNWKRIMLTLTGKMNITRLEDLASAEVHSNLEVQYLTKLDSYTPDEIRHRLKTYFKFMFVREPLERLLSAYQNKFNNPRNTYFTSRIGRKIVRRYRQNPSNVSLTRGHDVTFEEFVRYLINESHTTSRSGIDVGVGLFNAHWRPFYKLCLPCVVNYDVIGKYEMLSEDAEFTLQRIGLKGIVKFPAYSGRNRTSRLLAESFRNISPDLFRQLLKIYDLDYSLFGYSYPRFGRPEA